MKIEQVTEYVAYDGKRFREEWPCLEYEAELATVTHIMRMMPDTPPDGTYVECDCDVLKQIKRDLWALVLSEYGERWPAWKDWNVDDVRPDSIVGRVLSDCRHGPLEDAWAELQKCDFASGRVYKQPYYVLHPEEARLLES